MSSDARVRQLNVRRLLTMIRLTLELELQWAVFEPAHELAGTIRHLVGVFLRRLWQAGALVGGTEHEAFYVRCDETTTQRADADAGRLITEVGVAPTEPMEYLIVSLDCRDTPVSTEVGLA